MKYSLAERWDTRVVPRPGQRVVADLAMLQGHAESDLLPFSKGGKQKQVPRFPKWVCRWHVWRSGAGRAAKGRGGEAQ